METDAFTEEKVDDFSLDHAENEDDGNVGKCGIGRCQFGWSQWCANMKCFAGSLALYVIFNQGLGMYILSQITTLEKQFQLSSSEASFFLVCNEIGFIISSLALTHFLRKSHIPRILAGLSILAGLVGIFNALPHFIMLGDDYSFSGGRSRFSRYRNIPKCDFANETSRFNSPRSCKKSTSDELRNVRQMAVAIICVGTFLMGLCKGPRGPLGVTFLEDNTKQTKTGYYLGILSSCSVVGPMIAFTAGALFNRIHVSLSDTPMSPYDPRWIGAWWLGFIVFGVVTMIATIPLACFPKSIRRNQNQPRKKTGSEYMKFAEKMKTKVKDYPRAIWRLLTNPAYVLQIVAGACTIFTVSGLAAFTPKYLEIQFNVLPWMANIAVGSSVSVAALLGSLIGGCATSRAKLGVKGCLIIVIVTRFISAFGFLAALFLECPPITYHGHEILGVSNASNAMCNAGCSCTDADFLPVCGSDRNTYFSPCHAGCQNATRYRRLENCACISAFGNGTVVPGKCEPPCSKMKLFMAIYAIITFVQLFSLPSTIITNIRVVEKSDITLALGIGNIIATIAGWILGPVIFGRLIDSTCLLWGSKCGQRGACNIYNASDLRFKFHSVIIGPRVVDGILNCIALVCVIKMARYRAISSQNQK